MQNRTILWLVGGAALALVGSATATPITFSVSSGTRAASATFSTSGTNLIVTLTNTSSSDVLAPNEILTGVFFDIAGSALSLGRSSALLGGSSSVVFGPAPAGGVVGGEWAYLGGLSGAPHGAAYGISSAGFGLFGGGDLFPGPNLSGPTSPDGLQYGITSAGDNTATGNSAVTGDNELIQNQVVFTLAGIAANFDPSTAMLNVSFQYGTDLTEPNLQILAPLPSGGLMAIVGVGAIGIRRRRSI